MVRWIFTMKDTDAAYIAGLLMQKVVSIMFEELIKKKHKGPGIEKRIVGGLAWK